MPKVLILTGIVFYTILASSCGEYTSEPERPSNVPAEADWVGGEDGGSYIQCLTYNPKTGLARFIIYNDFSGQVEAKGFYKIADRIYNKKIEFSFSTYDGENIYLNDGNIFTPTDNVVYPSKHQ